MDLDTQANPLDVAHRQSPATWWQQPDDRKPTTGSPLERTRLDLPGEENFRLISIGLMAMKAGSPDGLDT